MEWSDDNGVYEAVSNEDVIEMRLAKYRAINYKSFIDTDWVEIKPLMLFYGNNSSGKTAICEPLLIIKRAYELKNEGKLYSSFSEMNRQFGDLTEIVNGSSQQGKLEFHFLFYAEEKEVEYIVRLWQQNEKEFSTVSIVTNNVESEITNMFRFVNTFFAIKDNSMGNAIFGVGMFETVMGIMNAFSKFINSFSYMEPVRIRPEREYTIRDTKSIIIGQDGTDSYSMLLSMIEEGEIKNQFVERWLKQLGFKMEWEPIANNRGKLILKNIKTGVKSNLVDNGYGVGQSLPVIVKMASMNNETMLLDSPEAFLQTNMQSVMGDFIIDCVNNKNNLFVESSSEYLLLRIRRRIAERKLDNSDVVLLYIDDGDGVAKCNIIEIDKYGKINSGMVGFGSFFSTNFEDMEKINFG